MKWSKERGVDLGSICACGKYFDFDRFVLRKPGIGLRWARSGYAVVYGIGIMVAVSTMLFAASPRALVSFNKTHTWALLGVKDARIFRQSNARFLTKEDCTDSQADIDSTHFSKEEVASLCQFFDKKTADQYVSSNVKVQRTLSISILLLIVCWLVAVRLSFFHVRAAWAMTAYLDIQKAAEDSVDAPGPKKGPKHTGPQGPAPVA